MLRFILRLRETSEELGGTRERMFTIDAELPQVEQQLVRGGIGPMGSEYVDVVGVEVLEPLKEVEHD
jgi:hypothetical protein